MREESRVRYVSFFLHGSYVDGLDGCVSTSVRMRNVVTVGRLSIKVEDDEVVQGKTKHKGYNLNEGTRCV
jgi:hypothetical protein